MLDSVHTDCPDTCHFLPAGWTLRIGLHQVSYLLLPLALVHYLSQNGVVPNMASFLPVLASGAGFVLGACMTHSADI